MKLNVTGIIYDRMVQNARDSARRETRFSGATPPIDNPQYQCASYEGNETMPVAKEMPEPERLFGDPPPKRDWLLLLKVVETATIVLVVGSFFALMFIAMGEASSGNGKSKRAAPVEVEVEK